MNALLHPRLSVKLGLVLLATVAGALGIVYAAVVPRLENRLVADRVSQLERSAQPVLDSFLITDPSNYDPRARYFQQALGARVALIDELGHGSYITVADSNELRTGNLPADPIARAALQAHETRTGTVDRDGDRAEVAVPMDDNTVLLLSASISDTPSSVRLVKRTLLLSGL